MTNTRDLTEFNLVYAQANDMAKTFPESQFKTIAALFVVVGWLLTASTAQQLIRSNAALLVPATVVSFTLLILFKGIWIYDHYKRANAVYGRLVKLAAAQGIAEETIEVFNLRPLVPLSFFVVNSLVCLSVIVTVCLVSK